MLHIVYLNSFCVSEFNYFLLTGHKMGFTINSHIAIHSYNGTNFVLLNKTHLNHLIILHFISAPVFQTVAAFPPISF